MSDKKRAMFAIHQNLQVAKWVIFAVPGSCSGSKPLLIS